MASDDAKAMFSAYRSQLHSRVVGDGLVGGRVLGRRRGFRLGARKHAFHAFAHFCDSCGLVGIDVVRIVIGIACSQHRTACSQHR